MTPSIPASPPVHATRIVLGSAVAKRLIDACEAKADAEGWKMAIAVADDGAHLKQFTRMDGAFLVSVEIAQLKAQTCARVPNTSREWGEFSKDELGLELVPGMVSFAGGLPIFIRGQHVGGLGVSGGTADQDEACAQAGLDAIAELLI